MIIKLGANILCDGADLDVGKLTGPSNLRMSLAREVQVKRSIGAEEVSLSARKNGVWTVSFGAIAEYESEDDAIAAAVELSSRMEESGETPLALSFDNVMLFAEAVVTQFECTPIGCSLQISYNLTATKKAD